MREIYALRQHFSAIKEKISALDRQVFALGQNFSALADKKRRKRGLWTVKRTAHSYESLTPFPRVPDSLPTARISASQEDLPIQEDLLPFPFFSF